MSWGTDKQIIIERYFEIININNIELFGIIHKNLDKINQVFPIIKFIISRLETVSILTTSERLWDAEIVLRSALETFLKFMYISSSDGDERVKRIDEYYNLLSEINRLKQSEQAKINLSFYSDSEVNRLAHLPQILDTEEEKLRIKWPKSDRQRLEQRWSFSEIIRSISRSNKGKSLEAIITLTHTYRICSHIMHGDETGVLMIEERESRPEKEFDKATRGHYLRLLNDCSIYCSLMAIETMNYLGLNEEKRTFIEIQNQLKDIENLEQKYRGKVFDDPDYVKYRSKSSN